MEGEIIKQIFENLNINKNMKEKLIKCVNENKRYMTEISIEAIAKAVTVNKQDFEELFKFNNEELMGFSIDELSIYSIYIREYGSAIGVRFGLPNDRVIEKEVELKYEVDMNKEEYEMYRHVAEMLKLVTTIEKLEDDVVLYKKENERLREHLKREKNKNNILINIIKKIAKQIINEIKIKQKEEGEEFTEEEKRVLFEILEDKYDC